MNNPPIGIYIDTEHPHDARDIEPDLTTGANGSHSTEITHAASLNIFQRKEL